jgi:hypothetical protein
MKIDLDGADTQHRLLPELAIESRSQLGHSELAAQVVDNRSHCGAELVGPDEEIDIGRSAPGRIDMNEMRHRQPFEHPQLDTGAFQRVGHAQKHPLQQQHVGLRSSVMLRQQIDLIGRQHPCAFGYRLCERAQQPMVHGDLDHAIELTSAE